MEATQATATAAGATKPQPNDSNNSAATNGSIAWLMAIKENGLVPLLLGGAAFIGLIFVLLLWVSAPEYRVLYSNLSEADGGRIITELDSRQVPYQIDANGTISVPSDQVHRLRLQLAEQGLPNAGNVGFSLLDNQAFGISQFAEKVNFQRALEGELASSMEALGPVLRARVHLAMAKDSVFVRDRQPAKASVVLTLHPGRKLGDGQIQAIVHMVSSSVADLAPDQVTVVDQHGALLSQKADNDALSGTKLDYVREIERTYQQRIEAILTPILGVDNLQAQVVAEVDFSKREATEERYTPNPTAETAAIRSIQRNLNVNGNGNGAQGVPGALTNTPPGVEPSPVSNAANAENNEQAVANNDADGNYRLQQDQVVNYELDRTISHIQHQQGVLQRLSVAVVVNHRTSTDEEGQPVLVPRSDEEIEYIQRLIRQAMGFSAERGDQLEVVNTAFVPEQEDPVVRAWYEQQALLDLIKQIIKYVAAGVAALLFYLLVLRPLLRRRQAAVEASASPAQRGQLRAVVGDDDEPTGASNATVRERATSTEAARQEPVKDDFNWPEKNSNQSYNEALTKAKEAAETNPRQVARILQNWIDEDDHV
ncbi:flagellar basal-body MS-ring/collar protein FliF [Pseudidiomarina homiensis]|uniref:Flagellar M-ring protein n=1 Tax=Pseudidiomarina homiensis TaxID=364198 RepID=A0A432Y711_9GAMM|nr:flagellar basal-body MS-ring/collar protein FliF [Pseudidiomarina homiensis]RUO56769.1 flagellar basal body M-ring protein FliF [Pseudidiomarina homiensis]